MWTLAMDPNYFEINWDRTGEVLVTVVVFSFMVERALALLFENRKFIAWSKDRNVKEIIAFALSFAVCWIWDLDALSTILLRDSTTILGYAITGAVIAGGSKASVKLFHDVLGVKSSASAEAKAAATKPAPKTTKTTKKS